MRFPFLLCEIGVCCPAAVVSMMVNWFDSLGWCLSVSLLLSFSLSLFLSFSLGYWWIFCGIIQRGFGYSFRSKPIRRPTAFIDEYSFLPRDLIQINYYYLDYYYFLGFVSFFVSFFFFFDVFMGQISSGATTPDFSNRILAESSKLQSENSGRVTSDNNINSNGN